MEANGYLELFERVKAKVGSDEVALAVVEQVGKDNRVEKMYGNGTKGNGAGNGDVPATEKQIGYLKSLGVEVLAGLTKKQASELIGLYETCFHWYVNPSFPFLIVWLWVNPSMRHSAPPIMSMTMMPCSANLDSATLKYSITSWRVLSIQNEKFCAASMSTCGDVFLRTSCVFTVTRFCCSPLSLDRL